MPTPRSLDTPASCPRLTAPRLPRLGHRSSAPTAHHPTELIPTCPTGGYLRAPLRSLCFRPLALPSAPVAPLRPASAASHRDQLLPDTVRTSCNDHDRHGRAHGVRAQSD